MNINLKTICLLCFTIISISCTSPEEFFDMDQYLESNGVIDPYFRSCIIENQESNNPEDLNLIDVVICIDLNITTIEGIEILSNLKGLLLSGNKIKNINVNANNLSQLQIINITNENYLEELSISNLININQIFIANINSNLLNIENNSEISTLHIYESSINTISLSGYTEDYLQLSYIVSDFISINNSSNIKGISIAGSTIGRLSLNDLSSLISLSSGSSNKSEISEIFLNNLPYLKTAFMVDSGISLIELNNLPEITTLSLTKNNITDFFFDDTSFQSEEDLYGVVYNGLIFLGANPLSYETEEFLLSLTDFYVSY